MNSQLTQHQGKQNISRDDNPLILNHHNHDHDLLTDTVVIALTFSFAHVPPTPIEKQH